MTSERRLLPVYQGRATELFDDSIEPTAVGFTWQAEGTASDQSATLRERVQTADLVARTRVVTVTTSGEGPAAVWEVGLHPVEILAGQGKRGDLTLVINATDPASGVLRATGSQLTGRTLVTFVREFGATRPTTETSAQLHFHIAPDSRRELDAVRDAALLGQVR